MQAKASHARWRTVALGTCLLAAFTAVTLTHRETLFFTLRSLTSLDLNGHCNLTPPAWFDEVIDWAQRHHVSGLQMHVRLGAETYDCAFGTTSSPGAHSTMRTNTVLPYASLTKVFTSTLVIEQAKAGTLDLNSSIYDLLGLNRYELKRAETWREVTPAQLLHHRGGFNRAASGDPMFWIKPPCPTHLELLDRVAIDFRPGSNYAYSNLGYCLLGNLLRQATGTQFKDILARNIAEPLQLSSVHVLEHHDSTLADSLIFFNDAERAAFESVDWNALEAVGAATGTARDFGRFLHELTKPNTRLGDAGSSLLTPLPHCDDSRWRSCHGLAFYSHHESGSKRMFWRDGSLPGTTAFAAVTSDGNVLVLLANSRDPRRWMSIHDDLGAIVYHHLGRTETATPPSWARSARQESLGPNK